MERLLANLEKFRAAYIAGAEKDLKSDMNVSQYLLQKIKSLYDKLDTFSEHTLSAATSTVSTVTQQQHRASARDEMLLTVAQVLESLAELVEDHERMNQCLANGGVADKLELRINRELGAVESLLRDWATRVAGLREELVEKCQSCREHFKAEASETMAVQMPRVIDIQCKIKQGLEDLASQKAHEKMKKENMIMEELAQLQDTTNKFLAADVAPTDPRFEHHLLMVNEVEMCMKKLNGSEDRVAPLQSTCNTLHQKLHHSDQVGEPIRKRRKLSTWVPCLHRLGGA